ncbi:MAG: outer membrane beta-barrel protein [Burkholderiales bacterium]
MRIWQLFALILAAALLAAVSTAVPAQVTAPSNPLLTRGGWEVGGQISHYHYEEPNFAKLTGDQGGAVGAYTFTSSNRVYSRIDLRVSYGSLKYEGSGTLNDVPDWIVEARAVIGGDYLTGDSVAFSPYIGLGFVAMEPANWTREYGVEVRYRF